MLGGKTSFGGPSNVMRTKEKKGGKDIAQTPKVEVSCKKVSPGKEKVKYSKYVCHMICDGKRLSMEGGNVVLEFRIPTSGTSLDFYQELSVHYELQHGRPPRNLVITTTSGSRACTV